MTTAPHHSITFQVSGDIKRHVESECARLNLTPSAYLVYLMNRSNAGMEPREFDRVVDAVFGRYGAIMRKLAQ